jgi:hypothetical protein
MKRGIDALAWGEVDVDLNVDVDVDVPFEDLDDTAAAADEVDCIKEVKMTVAKVDILTLTLKFSEQGRETLRLCWCERGW